MRGDLSWQALPSGPQRNCAEGFTRFLVADVDVESEDDKQSDQSCPPVDDEHHHAAQNRPSKGHPHVVVLEAGAPPCGVK